VTNGPVQRLEFEGYVRRHEADAFAHGALMERTSFTGGREGEVINSRLTALERWQQRIIGAGIFASVLIAGGLVGLVIELFRKP
jgi:hypothetical protein